MKLLLSAVIAFLSITEVFAQTEPREPAPVAPSRPPNPEAGSSSPQNPPPAATPASPENGPAGKANDPFQRSKSFVETELVEKGRRISTLDHLLANLYRKGRSFEGVYFFGSGAKRREDWRRLSENEKGFLRAVLPNWGTDTQSRSARPGDLLIDLQSGPPDGVSEPKGFVFIVREMLPGAREAKGMAYAEKGYKLPGNEVLTEAKWLSFEEKPLELYPAGKKDWESPFQLLRPMANALGPVAAIVAQDEHYLDYGIPADAKKIGPVRTHGDQDAIYYFPPGTDLHYSPTDQDFTGKFHPSLESLVAQESFNPKGALLVRILYKDGLPHGVFREWYPNGQLKSEKPYQYGTIQGVLRSWDEQGRLIGQSVLDHGAGTVSIYDSSGQLTRETRFVDNRIDGLQMERLPNGNCYFEWLTPIVTPDSGRRTYNDDGMTLRFRFFADGALAGIDSFREKMRQRKGYSVHFQREGAVQKIVWYVDRGDDSEADYAAAAKSDPTLPPYYADHTRYQELAGPEVHALAEKYLKMPKVKIPLEFDPAGNPALAP